MQTPALRTALEQAVRHTLPAGEPWWLEDVEATALRYKPGDRCVIRYRLFFGATEPASQRVEHVTRSVVGKVYRDVAQAREAATLLERLAASPQSPRWSPDSLGVVEPLPLALSEDLGGPGDTPPTVPGTAVIRPADVHAEDAVVAAARALADLHTGTAAAPDTPTRTGADEAARAAKRASVLTAYVPALAGTVAVAADTLTTHLLAAAPDTLVPAHGSYKPSQLLVRDGAVKLVDFDQFCLADPALDVGYFLAYLRPPGLWYHRAGTREWFEQAAATFTRDYDAALTAHGWSAASRSGVLARAHVYEAALLLKIAARRPNRLHSPRAGEVEAVMHEVHACLAAADAALGG